MRLRLASTRANQRHYTTLSCWANSQPLTESKREGTCARVTNKANQAWQRPRDKVASDRHRRGDVAICTLGSAASAKASIAAGTLHPLLAVHCLWSRVESAPEP